MKCIAIDDEPIALSIIAKFCQRMGDMEISTYTDPMLGLEYAKKTNPDIIFLDIEMGECNGVDIAKQLPNGSFLVFTTAYAQYALDGFELNAIDFLHKPFSFSRFEKAVNKASSQRKLQNLNKQDMLKEEELILKVEYKNVKIVLADILFAEAMDNYVRIHLVDARPVLTQVSLKFFATLLPKGKFLRVHKSYIVPLHRIAKYTRPQISLHGTSALIPVGRAYYDDLIDSVKNECKE